MTILLPPNEEEFDVIPSFKNVFKQYGDFLKPKTDKDSLEAMVKLVETSGPVSKLA